MRNIDIGMAEADPRRGAALAILQSGFSLRSRAGLSARGFMREVLGFEDSYIEGSVSTVFIDDSPVDDIDAAILREGSRIALSAAMPGLVGAVMRRHSPYAAFRASITHREGEGEARGAGEAGGGAEGSPAGPGEIGVRVKLFNSVMRDRGPAVLERGIILGAREAAEALASAGLDAGSAAPASGSAAAEDEEVLLRIRRLGT
ncbi:MAG TPA: hypothetical protein VMV44_01680 [Rectinemataceae bacterium]|nr:hypothetical protein [Rectinemataceae bacterium]